MRGDQPRLIDEERYGWEIEARRGRGEPIYLRCRDHDGELAWVPFWAIRDRGLPAGWRLSPPMD